MAVKNTGSCTWDTGYRLVFVSGNQLGGPSESALPQTVAPGETADVSVDLVSPASSGTYYSYWRLKNNSGQQFGIGTKANGVIWIKFTVSQYSTNPTATSVITPVNSTTCDWASFVADVTVPDNTNFAPGQSFIKIWRLKNYGSCTWTTGYKLIYVSGNQMSATGEIALSSSVAPGATIDIPVKMTSPSSAGGYYGFGK